MWDVCRRARPRPAARHGHGQAPPLQVSATAPQPAVLAPTQPLTTIVQQQQQPHCTHLTRMAQVEEGRPVWLAHPNPPTHHGAAAAAPPHCTHPIRMA